MSVYVVRAELEQIIAARAAEMNAGPYQVGLFQSQVTPNPDLAIGDITPCDFSGYDGLRDVADWPTSPDWNDPRAEITHPDVVWEHDGGTVWNQIFGFYVIDAVGALAWVDLRADGPVAIGAIGQTYTISPVLSVKSQMGE